jgi:hypothetical protein
MKLVIELDELAEVGKSAASEGARLTVDRVQKLIASSPSLVDVIGAAGIEDSEDEIPLGERALDFLLESPDTWHRTSTVREACGVADQPLLVRELKRLREEGRVVSRNAASRTYEWKAA